jgi:UPF0716 protein FxsA
VILEFSVFFLVAHWLGLLSAIVLLILLTVFGGMLIRLRGMEALRQTQLKIMMGQAAGPELMQGMAMMMAGFFFLVPGFLSSLIGLALLLPFTRSKVATWLLRHGFVKRQAPPRQAANEPEGRTIEGEAWRDK